MRVSDVQDVRATALVALSKGAAVIRRSTVAWDIAGRCSNAKSLTLVGRPSRRPLPLGRYSKRGKYFQTVRAETPRFTKIADTSNNPLWVDMEVPCRRCRNCLKARSRMWTERALAEVKAAGRTWMGTLTLSPASHFLIECRATHRLDESAVNWRKLTDAEQLAERHKEISLEVTLWLKRVRAESRAKLRFLAVMETHKSGLPHYHLLVHEGAVPVRKSVLTDQWKLGYSKFKLVKPEADGLERSARYVCKYLTKTNEARVRASVRYGNPAWADSDSVFKYDPLETARILASAEQLQGLTA